MRERDLQQAVIDLARLLGWLAYHPYDSRRSEPGFPDLVLVHPAKGRVLYRELKSERGRLSPAQRKWISALNQAGADADVWYPRHWPEQIKGELEAAA